MNIKKNKLIILALAITGFFINLQANQSGQLTNNGNVLVNVVMYTNYVAPTDKRSAKGRLNNPGTIIQPGQNISFLPGTTSIDIYYGNGNKPYIHTDVNSMNNYTVAPSSKENEPWNLTLD